MDKFHKYLDYSSDDFVEDIFFWKWVLGEDKVNGSIWKEFIKRNPSKIEAIEKARERVLQLNAEKYRLPSERVASIWAKIQESKNKITASDLNSSNSGLTVTLALNPPQALDCAIFVLTLYLGLLLS